MAKFNYYQSNFSAGEVSPRFGGRFDTQQLANSALKIENMTLMPQGGLIKRPGFRYIKTITGMNGPFSLGPYLIPFISSKTEGYSILLCPDGTNATFIQIVSNTGVAASITVDSLLPVVPTSLSRTGWQYAQSADVIWITHNSGTYPPLIIRRRAVNDFYVGWPMNYGYTDVYFGLQVPYLDPNIDPNKCLRLSTVTPGAASLFAETSGGVAISFFHAAQVGAVFKISVSGITSFFTVAAFVSASQVTGFLSITAGATTRTDDWEESAWSNYQGWPRSVCFYQQRLVFGGTILNPDMIFLSLVGNPFHFMQLRLDQDLTTDVSGVHYFGSPAVTDPFNFIPNSAEVNSINWLASGNDLVAGTLGAEFVINGGNLGTLLSKSSIQVQAQTSHGSSSIRPVKIDNNLHFISREGRRLLDFQFDFYSNNYKSTNYNLTADHIPQYQLEDASSPSTSCVFTQSAYQEARNILWMVNGRGSLTAITINKEAQVIGWHTHHIGGANALNNESFAKVAGICILPNSGGTYDEIFAVIQRTINSNTVFYLEKMGPDFTHPYFDNSFLSLDDVPMFLDSSLYIPTPGSATITGLSHLEGETVEAIADGLYVGEFVVASGQIVLPSVATASAIVGIPYSPTLYMQKLEAGQEFGSAQGNVKRVDRVTIKFDRTYGAKVGIFERNNLFPYVIVNEETLEDVEFNPGSIMLPAIQLFSGEKRIQLSESPETENVIVVTQRGPFPMTILGITLRGVTYD